MKKSVFVTGATSGTGIAIASRFAKEGYDVFLTSRDKKRAEETAEEISKKYNCFAKGYLLETDSEQKVIDVFDDIRSLGYLIDTAVMNAADLGIGMNIFETSREDFMKVFNTNVGWNYSIARQAAIQMREKGGGAIVFITSNTAYRAIKERSAYCASKSGLLGLARALSVDLGPYGIRTNCVLPGVIKTPRYDKIIESGEKPLAYYTPLGDVAEFEDIANAAWYLGSEQSRNTTGAEILVDGGNSVQLHPDITD